MLPLPATSRILPGFLTHLRSNEERTPFLQWTLLFVLGICGLFLAILAVFQGDLAAVPMM